MVSREVVESALGAFDARSDIWVLDVLEDSDLDSRRALAGPRRLRFRGDDLVVDVLVQDRGGPDGLQVLVRLAPRGRFLVRAGTRGRDLTVETAVASSSDTSGVARLTALPHGVTTFYLEGMEGRPRARTAWLRI